MPPLSLEQLLPILKNELLPIFQKFRINFAYLGGSWVRHQNALWSDIDIFVSWPECETMPPSELLSQWTQLNVEAATVTHLDAIEIAILEKTPLHVQFNVISEGILLFESTEENRVSFVEHLLREYPDHRIWYEEFLKVAMAKMLGQET